MHSDRPLKLLEPNTRDWKNSSGGTDGIPYGLPYFGRVQTGILGTEESSTSSETKLPNRTNEQMPSTAHQFTQRFGPGMTSVAKNVGGKSLVESAEMAQISTKIPRFLPRFFSEPRIVIFMGPRCRLEPRRTQNV